MDENEMWNHVKNLVQSEAPISDVAEALSKLTKQEIEDRYEDGQNLLHYTVSSNNLPVARLLFEEECFLPPHESKTVPYLHVACFKGFNDMVDLLLENRPEDEMVEVLANDTHWKRFIPANSFKGDEYEALQTNTASSERRNEKISAYEVAALCRQLTCLKNLLKYYAHEKWPCLLVERSEPRALEFLLDTEVFDLKSLQIGFETSLLLGSPQCLEVMLKYAAQKGIFYIRSNPYHILYTTGSCTADHPLAECTRLLIRYGWDVNVMDVQATYPLYSLLRRVIDDVDAIFYESGTAELKPLDDKLICLSELLVAGADPNFNEKANDHSTLPATDFRAEILGNKRLAFSSASEALVALLHHTFNPCLIEFVTQTASLLAKFGCFMKGQRSWLGKMSEMNQAVGLKILLDVFDFTNDSLNYGFEASLYYMSPSCLETMLQYAAENNISFHQKNPFHFLYLYTSDEGWLDSNSPEECTRALINYGWNVKEIHRPASYPLYTLLSVATASYNADMWEEAREQEVLKEVYVCLSVLLDAGADPNFEELAPNFNMAYSSYEASFKYEVQTNSSMIDGRKQYSSAAETMMDMINCMCEFDPYFLDFIARTLILLVNHGADVTFVNDDGQSLLHIFLRGVSVAYDYFSLGEGIVLEALGCVAQVMRSLLAGGADINAKDCFSKLPLTYYSERLSECIANFMCNLEVEDDEMLELVHARLMPVFRFVDVMEMKEAQEVVREFAEAIDDFSGQIDFGLTVLDSLREEVLAHVRVRSLYNSCLIKVWRYCDFKLAKTQELELPWNIKHDLNEMLSFNFGS